MAQRAHAGQPIEDVSSQHTPSFIALTRSEKPHTIKNLERWLQESKERERLLTSKNERLEETIKSHNYWAERRQADYEELRDKWANLHHDKLDLTAEVAKAQKDLGKARFDKLALQGERGALNKELADTRQQLMDHAEPAIAEKAQQDATIRSLEADIMAQKKKFDSLNNQMEYTRKMYQDSSNRAVDLSEEVEELQRKMEPLERQLEHERARRKHERLNNPTAPLLKEIENLKTKVLSREKFVSKKEDEIGQLKRGRGGVQTRGSSVQPRSPKGGSRGASPAAGMLGGGAVKGPSGLNRNLGHLE